MSDPMLIGLFLLLVFAPCLVAYLSASGETVLPEKLHIDQWERPDRDGETAAPLQGLRPEASLAEDFVIRSFAKGISQRRIVVRDTESGVRLTIAQVRAAAIELYKLGGQFAAHELALVTAASAAATTSFKDAVAIAAREALEAARNAYEWFAWADSLARDDGPGEVIGPRDGRPFVVMPMQVVGGRWREISQAA